MGGRSGREGGARKGGRVKKPLSQSRVWPPGDCTACAQQIRTREHLNGAAGGRGTGGAQM